MGKITKIRIVGKDYPMSFSLGAAKKITQLYGGVKNIKTRLKEKDLEIDSVVDILDILIRQGCAFKNYFEADLPPWENAPVEDGKWIPLPKEAIEVGVMVSDIEEIGTVIEECIGEGGKKEVEGKSKGKAKAAP